MFLLAVGVVPDVRAAGRPGFRSSTPSGLMRRRANSIAARINVALASPTPSNCVRSSALNFQALFVNQPRQLSGERHDVHAWRALAQQNRQQFLIAQGRCALCEAAFRAGGRLSGIWSMVLLMLQAANDRVRLDHRHRHDVEDAAGVRVFGIGQFLVTATLVVGRLNLAVDLAAISAFEDRRGLRGGR